MTRCAVDNNGVPWCQTKDGLYDLCEEHCQYDVSEETLNNAGEMFTYLVFCPPKGRIKSIYMNEITFISYEILKILLTYSKTGIICDQKYI